MADESAEAVFWRQKIVRECGRRQLHCLGALQHRVHFIARLPNRFPRLPRDVESDGFFNGPKRVDDLLADPHPLRYRHLPPVPLRRSHSVQDRLEFCVCRRFNTAKDFVGCRIHQLPRRTICHPLQSTVPI